MSEASDSEKEQTIVKYIFFCWSNQRYFTSYAPHFITEILEFFNNRFLFFSAWRDDDVLEVGMQFISKVIPHFFEIFSW